MAETPARRKIREVVEAKGYTIPSLPHREARMADYKKAWLDSEQRGRDLEAETRALREAGNDLVTWLENAGNWQPDDPVFLATLAAFRAALAAAAGGEDGS